MKDAGIDCDFLDERPLPGFTGKAIARYVPVVNERKVRENIRQRLSENHYDYLLVIKGESLSTKLLSDFKQANPGAKRCFSYGIRWLIPSMPRRFSRTSTVCIPSMPMMRQNIKSSSYLCLSDPSLIRVSRQLISSRILTLLLLGPYIRIAVNC